MADETHDFNQDPSPNNDPDKTELPEPGNTETSANFGQEPAESEANLPVDDDKERPDDDKERPPAISELPQAKTAASHPPDRPQRKGLILAIIAASLASAAIASLITVALISRPFNSNFTPLVNQSETKTDFPVEQIAKNVSPAVVNIINYQSGKGFLGSSLQAVGSGSGFIIDSQKGYIVTNNHVIENAQKLTIGLYDGSNPEAKIIGADPQTDLAVLQISNVQNLPAVRLGDSAQLAVGEPVVAIGNPGGNDFARSVTTGVVSATNRTLSLQGEAAFDLIQTDAAINPGNSGGPLVDYQGLVIGINSAKYAESGFEGMGFSIPISSALPTIQQLINTGSAKHPALLVSINDQYNSYAQYRNLPQGAYIADLTANGPAAKAGLIKGDVITKINNVAVENSSDLVHELYQHQVGDVITVTYLRNGKTGEVQATLGEISSSGR
jgi:serine protease Do